jgi:beta-glucosidase
VPLEERLLRDRLARLTLEQKVRLLTGADFWALHAEPGIGLRRVVTSDGPAGVRGERWDEREPSANVPSPTALAATWDEARIERIGRLLAAEARRKGVDVLLAPTVNLQRTPYGGRHFECFSEDPLLTARIGAAYVRGVQGEGVAATVKHFVANDSETERFTLDARVGERALRELYLAPFEAIVRETRPWAVMAAYNGVNGATMTESPLLREVLKQEWGFDGVVMSDWYAARTTAAAGRAGLDLVMPGPAGPWGEALVAAVRAGEVGEEAVDDKVLRILRLAGRVGALEGVEPPAAERQSGEGVEPPAAERQSGEGVAAEPAASPWADDDVAAELRATAAASFVLARNDRLLPLDAGELRSVAVIGPNAAVARTLGGGSATVFPAYTVSPLEGLRAALGPGVRVDHAAGVRSHTRLPLAAPAQLLLPDGSGQGVEVRFLAADGTVLGAERRFGASYAWQGTLGERVTAVEARCRIRAHAAGRHVIGCSGQGHFRLALGDAPAAELELRLPPGADIAEAHMRPPQHGRPVVLAEREEVAVALRHELEGPIAVFQLNVDPPQPPDDEGIEQAVALAAGADVAVVVVGTTEEVESEGFDRSSLALPGRQDELVRRVAGANPRTVLVVNAGAPVLLPWAGAVPAVLLAWFPGQEFGHALADVLLGAAEPGGRLPTTWPAAEERLPSPLPEDGVLAYEEDVYVGYRAYDRDGRAPLFPFGHGDGYTTWEYLALDAAEAAAGGAEVTVRLRNSGARAGREVVQLYAERPAGAVERPPRALVGFAVADAGPGEEVAVEVAVPARSLAHWDGAGWAVEPGAVTLAAGRSSRDLRLRTQIELGRATASP